jgi:hypothetical protein
MIGRMLRRGKILAAVAAGLALLASTASAQVADEILQATAGNWLLAPEDGRPGCRVQLRATEAAGGYELRPSPSCLGVRTIMVTAIAWRFDAETGGLAFSGPRGETLLAFTEKEDGTYASAGEPGDVLLLLKAPPGVTAVPNARAIFGSWSVLEKGGADLCRITFSDQPPEGGEESYALSLADGCSDKLANLKLASWRIEGLALMLYGTDGDTLAFQPAAKGTFVADDAKPPLILVRR